MDAELAREQACVDWLVATMRQAPLAHRIPPPTLAYLATLIATDAQCAHKLAGAAADRLALTEMRHGLQLAARACCWRLGLLDVRAVEPIPRGAHGQDVQLGEWFGYAFPELVARVADLDDPED